MLLTSLISMRYMGKGNISEYIMEMSHLVSKLRALKLELSKDLLVHLVFVSLPTQINQFKVRYNCQKETQSLNELISHCLQEKDRLKKDKVESAHLTSTFKGKKMKNDKEAAKTTPQKKQQRKLGDPESTDCFFCRAEGHKKKHCTNYHTWHTK